MRNQSRARTKGAKSLATLVCWTIWMERNARVFEGEEKTVQRLLSEIADEATMWAKAGAKHLAILVRQTISE
jgi:hypothetical protein